MRHSSGEKVRITCAPELSDLLPKYLLNRRQDFLTLQRAAKEHDFQTIASLCHKIKGHAVSYGFIELSEIAKRMELASQAQAESVLNQLIDEFGDYLNRVEL